MLLTWNVLLLNAAHSLDNGLPKYLQDGVLYSISFKLEYIIHKIVYVNFKAVTALPCNSKFYFVTLK